MTNEEAAHILHAIKFILPSRFYKDYIEEALNMGMDALKERDPERPWYFRKLKVKLIGVLKKEAEE